MKPPAHHWHSYGNDPLPTPAEAPDQPFAAFPSWFLRITMRDILARARHDGCGGLAGQAVLLTGIEGVSSRPVRRIVLMG